MKDWRIEKEDETEGFEGDIYIARAGTRSASNSSSGRGNQYQQQHQRHSTRPFMVLPSYDGLSLPLSFIEVIVQEANGTPGRGVSASLSFSLAVILEESVKP